MQRIMRARKRSVKTTREPEWKERWLSLWGDARGLSRIRGVASVEVVVGLGACELGTYCVDDIVGLLELSKRLWYVTGYIFVRRDLRRDGELVELCVSEKGKADWEAGLIYNFYRNGSE